MGTRKKIADEIAKRYFTNANFAFDYCKFIDKNPTSKKFEEKYNTTFEDVKTSIADKMLNSLLPWTNEYNTKLKKTLKIKDDEHPRVVWGDAVIKNFTFKNGCLRWETDGGNDSNGEVYFAENTNDPERFDPEKVTAFTSIRGFIWTDDEKKPECYDLIGIPEFRGSYEIDVDKEKHTLEIANNPRGPIVFYDSKQIEDITYNSFTLTWSKTSNSENAKLLLLTLKHPNGDWNQMINGKIWSRSNKPSKDNARGWKAKSPAPEPDPALARGYNTTVEDVQKSRTEMCQNSLLPWTNRYNTNLGKILDIDGSEDPSRVVWGNKVIHNFEFKNSCLTWKTADGNDSNAEVYFTEQNTNDSNKFDPEKITGLRGSIWNDGEEQPECDDLIGLPSAFYGIYEMDVDQKKYTLEIVDHSTGPIVVYDDNEIENLTYTSSTLTWSNAPNRQNAILKLLLQGKKLIPGINGKIFSSGSIIPPKINAAGKKPLQSYPKNTNNTVKEWLKKHSNFKLKRCKPLDKAGSKINIIANVIYIGKEAYLILSPIIQEELKKKEERDKLKPTQEQAPEPYDEFNPFC